MAVTYACSFEAQQSATDDLALFSGATYSTAQQRTGAASARCNPASGGTSTIQTNAGSGAAYVHFGLRVASLPSVDRWIAGNTSNCVGLKLTSSGAIAFYDNNTLRGTSSTTLSTGTWYWIGARNVSGTSVDCLQIDGVSAGITGDITAPLVSFTFGPFGTEASAIDLYYDDLIFDGAGFLAPSKVDIALPISDNTRTAVTTNSGGTSNLWDCVNNTPPAGVASASEAAAGAVSILYPASLTEDYIANLETYTTLGVGATDTVLAVRSIVRQGEDVATGTKNFQNVGALTNPTVSGASVVAGGDAGAHGAETGLWVTTFGTLTTSPSVTVGTSPTIRTSRTSEARVACIDFMGMTVVWTPAAAAGYAYPAMTVWNNRRLLL